MEPQATPAPPTPPIPTPTMPDPYDQSAPTPPTVNTPVPSTPEPIQPPDSKISQKLLIPSIVLLIVAVILVAFKLILTKKVVTPPQPSPTASTQPTPSPTPDPTADWKTYTNTLYGISFKYPNSAEYEVTHYTNTEFNVTFKKLTEFPYEEMIVYVGKNWAYTNTNADTAKNYSLGGIQGYREDLPSGQNPPQSIVYVKHNNFFYTIQQTKDIKDPSIETIFNQILSTFRFTE